MSWPEEVGDARTPGDEIVRGRLGYWSQHTEDRSHAPIRGRQTLGEPTTGEVAMLGPEDRGMRAQQLVQCDLVTFELLMEETGLELGRNQHARAD